MQRQWIVFEMQGMKYALLLCRISLRAWNPYGKDTGKSSVWEWIIISYEYQISNRSWSSSFIWTRIQKIFTINETESIGHDVYFQPSTNQKRIWYGFLPLLVQLLTSVSPSICLKRFIRITRFNQTHGTSICIKFETRSRAEMEIRVCYYGD